MNTFKSLNPEIVWTYFEQICQVPRPSKKEEKIIKFLQDFGKKHNLETKVDKAGNVLIKKNASKGNEKMKTVLLQSHMDMVCEKNNDTVFDFDNDSIIPFVSGEWVKAKGTTLGADDGIGMAAQMAILASNDIEHGAIECLFTVDEETGLTGAFALEEGFLNSDILLNLDSEDEGQIFIGCAGGVDTVATFDDESESVPSNHIAYRIDVKGLQGGHSGDEIHKGLGNSNKILNRFLWENEDHFELRLSVFDGGNLRNAIPREAYAIVTVNEKLKNEFIAEFKKYSLSIKDEFSVTEPKMELTINETSLPKNVIDENTQFNLFNSLYACPHGVYAWSAKMPGLVETSTNLASVKFKNNKIEVTTSQRSSVNSAKEDIANMVESVFTLAGADVKHGEGYPGWAPNPDSEILKISVASYKKLFGNEPEVRAIHAGLECGLFLEKYPKLDMISFGPTIKGAHSPEERINIKTVEMWWAHLLDILKLIPKK
ncbi:MAG TPA: cytosol nonspecific dipeptidase [Bacteroidales bacterium]|nr:MAG: cytosol nonspecific dipeptidase [Bacteroidetes bacterium GWF2_33_38]OFY68123.1 MAG: cytosol nonspecific dipeptidase [Bacteroidetes bacterium RIFOXYA12_FULL_33_9]OFY91978.1 MAG: cytosol nonspecific dipeptidase [Bacteroidetes bacterium RIFOXYA2_FULL_33_7]HBF88137.1 cytosol nonspecific dipeptidase [Bacteroidales bacterium]